jgi:hypothetical protein
LLDVEYVGGNPLFRSYPREQNSKSATRDGLGYDVKETLSVGRPDFDDDSAQGYVTVDVDSGRDFGSETIFVTKESAAIGLLSLFVNQVTG